MLFIIANWVNYVSTPCYTRASEDKNPDVVHMLQNNAHPRKWKAGTRKKNWKARETKGKPRGEKPRKTKGNQGGKARKTKGKPRGNQGGNHGETKGKPRGEKQGKPKGNQGWKTKENQKETKGVKRVKIVNKYQAISQLEFGKSQVWFQTRNSRAVQRQQIGILPQQETKTKRLHNWFVYVEVDMIFR